MNFIFITTVCSGPSRTKAGPGKTLSRGPIPPFCMSWDRDAVCVEREETWGEVSPHHSTRGSGSIVSSPSGVWDGAPAENIFSIFEWRRGTPNVAGPVKTPPPLSMGLTMFCSQPVQHFPLTCWSSLQHSHYCVSVWFGSDDQHLCQISLLKFERSRSKLPYWKSLVWFNISSLKLSVCQFWHEIGLEKL